MSGRLASFRGPSTPSASPVQSKYPPKSPASPSRAAESTYHRKVRTSLQEVRNVCRTWDGLVHMDGLKAAKALVDSRTELHNQLALLTDSTQPRTRMVGPKLEYMEERIVDLDIVVSKLKKQFQKMTLLIENLEVALADAHKAKGWAWVQSEPLWTTWSLEKFVSSIASILRPYRRSLDLHTRLVDILRPHSVSFKDARSAIQQWVEEAPLEDENWDAKWEDLCIAEIDRWDAR
ncbi:hypothetical protein FA95DRAFT_1558488 [Auriscalpium vulgare]|uniref:Uncharacterized protein n=1 Tax=Auriscalpium vulgare TaxID=40419 RepID=A0ACB8RUS0_9AGAM|nr:hypothetical protein FA95DRAFT_1558488 [Auriscalpium vulgare]